MNQFNFFQKISGKRIAMSFIGNLLLGIGVAILNSQRWEMTPTTA